MARQVQAAPEAGVQAIRAVGHAAGVRYLDLTPGLLLVAAGLVAARFVALGLDDRDLYILAFGPHKNLALRAQALEAGADRVVANSAFIRLLPTVLATPTADVHDDEDA